MRAIRTTTISILAVGLLAGSAVGAAAQDEEAADPMAPAAATIEITSINAVSQGTRRTDDAGVTHIDGVHHEHVWESTDPRLSGTVTYSGNWEDYPSVPMQIESATYEVVNEGGRWFGPATALAVPSSASADTVLLRGEGGYEGLTAYVLMDWSTDPPKVHAAIFAGEMPPFPEPVSAE